MEVGVQRWAVNIRTWTPSESLFSAFVDLLPLYERPLVLRYIKFEDRKRALVSRLLQRKLVHTLLKIAYDDIRIERTREGKPYLANRTDNSPFPNLNFNVAHHGNYVVLASEPVCLVGVDIMTHQPVREESPVTFFEPFRHCYTTNEWNMVFSAGPDAGPMFDQFYRLWCLKEGYIKAVGIGLGFELTRAEFSHPGGHIWSTVANVQIDGHEKPNWHFSLGKLGDDHWVCVARGPANEAGDSYRKTLQLTEFDQSAFARALALPEKEFTLLEVWDLVPDSEKEKFATSRP
ncbi:unnamed protein product [Calypogeia fissa]